MPDAPPEQVDLSPKSQEQGEPPVKSLSDRWEQPPKADADSSEAHAHPAGFWGVEPREAEDGTPDINFKVLRPGAPPDQRDLKAQAERALTIIKALYHTPEDRLKLNEAVAKLTALCQVGLVGANSSSAVAMDALRALEADIVEREAGPIKNLYMRKLGGWALLFGGAGLVAYLFCQHLPWIPFEEFHRYRTVFLVWAGSMAGAWASFASRKVTLTFADLVALEEDRIEPQLRLVFTGTLTVVLALVFTTGVADVEVGSFKASALMSSGSVALLLGVFAGLAEKALPSTVMSRATSVITAANPT